MTPGARCQAAIELLEALDTAIRQDGAPADRLISGWFRQRRFIGSKDRRAVSGMVYGVLRALAPLDWHLETNGVPVSPRGRMLAWLATESGWHREAIEAAFDGGKYCPEPLDPDGQGLLAALAGAPLLADAMPPAVRVNCPAWLAPRFEEAFGPDFEAEMRALNQPATLDLRVNTLRTDRESVVALLAGEGVRAEPTPFAPAGLRIVDRVNLPVTDAWKTGLIDVQDEGSQIAALLSGAAPGLSVLDSCAGAGGKTLAMAALMENQGRIVATDIDPGRLTPVAGRARRAGVDIIDVQKLWITHKDNPEQALEAEEFDAVLVDAPCSGSGTWRRNPDARWRLSDTLLTMYAEQQYEALAESANRIRRGGQMTYVTCSVLPEENEIQIARLTEHRTELRVVPVAEVWRRRFGADLPAALQESGPYLHLTPARHGTDGFFVAVLERGP